MAAEQDVKFLNDIVNKECPKYTGYNTAAAREKGQELKPKTVLEYKPLIDMNPADPDTIMTSLFKAQEFTKATGQDFIVFTSDLQLHKVAQKILWAYPEQFSNVVLRLGGMHMLMSFMWLYRIFDVREWSF